jgi:putative oxidoreductase
LKSLFQNTGFELIARWVLGGLFLFACYHKIVEPAHFAKIIYGYYLFPDFSINLIAIILPFLELFAGIALVLGIYPRSAVLIINATLFAFIVAISINLIRGHEFDCGCFSFGAAGDTFSVVQLLLRDIVCFLLGLQVLFFDNSRKWCVRQSGSILGNLSSN